MLPCSACASTAGGNLSPFVLPTNPGGLAQPRPAGGLAVFYENSGEAQPACCPTRVVVDMAQEFGGRAALPAQPHALVHVWHGLAS
jgi:hypothetical protein